MLGYPLFFLLFLLFSIIRNRKSSLLWLFFLLFIFSAIRYKIGYDYVGYLDVIHDNHDPDYFSRFEELEPFSKFLIVISTRYYEYLFFIISSFITVYAFWYGIKMESTKPKISLLLYACLPFFMVLNFTIVRNGLAYALVFLALTTFRESKYKQLILIFIAYMFHQSAALALIILLPWSKINRVKYLWIMFISAFFVLNIVHILMTYLPALYIFQRFDYYMSDNVEHPGGTFMLYLVYGINILFLIKYETLVKLNAKYKYYIPLICLGASIYAVFEIYYDVALRFCVYFYSILLIALPDLFKIYKIKNLAICFGCICLFVFYIINMHAATVDKRTNISPVYPYRTIFNN